MFAARNMMFAGVSAAGAYIAAVETALGSSITETQKTAIGAFIEAEQVGGRWNAHGRLYLPIWGNAAANAICLKSLTSGTFAGTVTHGAGYVQGNGSNSYFNTAGSAYVGGASGTNFRTMGLMVTALSGGLGGTGTGSNAFTVLAGVKVSYGGSLNYTTPAATQTGIISAIRRGSATEVYRRQQTARTLLGSNDQVQTAHGLPVSPLFFMAHNNVSLANQLAPSYWSSSRFGAFGFGAALSADGDAANTLNLKTLWETCTGLTLP